jgi:O-antigen/teichoic acid export membrane protein
MKKPSVSQRTHSPVSMITGTPSAGAERVSKRISTLVVGREPRRAGDSAVDPTLHDLKRNTARGAVVSFVRQGANFTLRTGSMVILARLLSPADFGLVGMVTACTGLLGLFRDAGLSHATVQSATITRAQTSMLFWVNLAVGTLLAGLCAAIAPLIAAFYHEPRLLWVTIVIGVGFVFSGAAAQHGAMLQRNLRFTALAIIDILSLVVGIAVGIGMALAGQGYWALVATSLSPPVMAFFGVWVAGGWIPGLPRRGAGVQSMLRYGGSLTLNWVICYIAYNVDKVLVGRFLGAEALGIYGRAYTIVNLPSYNLSSIVHLVGFPALSRLQNDPERLRSYFLKGYGLFLTLMMPITMGCALFAEDIIHVFLGPKWGAVVPVFRLLVPTSLVLAMIDPFNCLLLATSRMKRILKMTMLIAPVLILGYVAGLSYGPTGVAAGFSIASIILVVPVILWATHGTPISALDTLREVIRPFLAVLIGAGAALASWNFVHMLASPLLRLIAAGGILFGVYAVVLWFVMDQKAVYLGLLREIGVWPFARRHTPRP